MLVYACVFLASHTALILAKILCLFARLFACDADEPATCRVELLPK